MKFVPPDAQRKRLQNALFAFVLFLSLPLGALLFLVGRSVENEEYLRLRGEALRVLKTIQDDASTIFQHENQRPFEQFSFFNVNSNALFPEQDALGFSSLSSLSASTAFPGALGYFQLNPEGTIQTPLLPDISAMSKDEATAILGEELQGRLAVKRKLEEQVKRLNLPILRPPKTKEAEAAVSDVDEVSNSQQQVVKLPQSQSAARYLQKSEQNGNQTTPQLQLGNEAPLTFKTAVGEIEFYPLKDSFAFVRKVSINRKIYYQGFIVSRAKFLETIFKNPFLKQPLSQTLSLLVKTPDGETELIKSETSSFSSTRSKSLVTFALKPPLQNFELALQSDGISLGRSGRMVVFLAFLLLAVLALGLWALYRLGVAQIRLAQERGNFVSAVSHELKTPLTSIRMYAEMLDGNLVPNDEKRKGYYRFILSESERLSRLVENVLTLGKFERGEENLHLRPIDAASLLETAAAKIRVAAESAGYQLTTRISPGVASSTSILGDEDAFCQVAINLADNAFKFAAQSERREFEIALRTGKADSLEYVFRDFGPGVPEPELKNIFRLFYRIENELTRKTKGTGLGLGLVTELVRQMKGEIEAKPGNPGLEVVVRLKRAP